MKAKYQVGQKVRITDTDSHNFKMGQIVSVVTVVDGEDGFYDLKGTIERFGPGNHTQIVRGEQFEPSPDTLDLTQPVFTAEGTPVQIVATTGRDAKFPVLAYEGKATTLSKFSLEGKSKTGVARRHLTNVQADPQPEREFYVNLYDGAPDFNYDGADVGGVLYESIQAATKGYEKGRSGIGGHPKRVGIAKVVLVEGRLPKRNLKGE